MAYQAIGLGTNPNDGNGDTLRTGGDKVNDNCTEIYRLLGGTSINAVSASGLHAGATLTDAAINNTLTAPDDAKIRIGAGPDLDLYHSSGHSYIESNTGTLYIQSDALHIRTDTGTESMITGTLNAGVVLHYNGTAALTTTATGVTVAGDLTVSGDDIILTTNTSGYLLIADGTNYNPVSMSGDITINNTGATTIGAGKVAAAMMKTPTSLIIYDSSGSAVKTINGAGA